VVAGAVAVDKEDWHTVAGVELRAEAGPTERQEQVEPEDQEMV
jgi:hypothetical protein